MSRWRTKVKETIEANPMQWSAVVMLPNGEQKQVNAGDFLITREDGTQEFMGKEEFLDRYEEVRQGRGGGRPKGSRNTPKDLALEIEDEADSDEFLEGEEDGEGEEEPAIREVRPHPKPNQRKSAPIPQPLR